MKFTVTLLVFFATIFVAQAQNWKLETVISHDKPHEITGDISLKIEGPTETKEVSFPKKEMFNFERLEMYVTFSEKIEKVTLTWKADKPGTYIKTGILVFFGDNEVHNFAADNYFFEDGESQVLEEF